MEKHITEKLCTISLKDIKVYLNANNKIFDVGKPEKIQTSIGQNRDSRNRPKYIWVFHVKVKLRFHFQGKYDFD